MLFEIIETTNPYDETINKFVIIKNNDGSFKSFPVDEANPEYLAWKAEQ